MECNILNSVAQTSLTRFKMENIDGVPGNMVSCNLRKAFQRSKVNAVCTGKDISPCASWRISCAPVNLQNELSSIQSKQISKDGEPNPKALPDEVSALPLGNKELKSLLGDSERSKLLKKLSEANQHNRFLKRQLQVNDDALVTLQSELAVVEHEIQALVSLAEEIAKSDIPKGSRKINGKYIQSHLFSRLKAVQGKLKEQTKDVDAAQSKEIPLSWVGVAESVQVMGSFDGWSQGEHLSPEYTGSYTKFSTTLFLRLGRYEIKFLVDGEWKLSPELPIVGEGLTKNNLLVVE